MKLAIDVATGLQPPVDLLCVDVFDGEDNVPASLRSAGTKQNAEMHGSTCEVHPCHFPCWRMSLCVYAPCVHISADRGIQQR